MKVKLRVEVSEHDLVELMQLSNELIFDKEYASTVSSLDVLVKQLYRACRQDMEVLVSFKREGS